MSDQVYWVWLSLCFPPACERLVTLVDSIDPAAFYWERPRYAFLKISDYATFQAVTLEDAQSVIDRCRRMGVRIVTMEDRDYPDCLLEIYCPPPVLYLRGTLDAVDQTLSVAVVGTRKASDYYRRAVRDITYQIAGTGAIIVSGCAVGLDSVAHEACLRAKGCTIGVLACGIDVDYPAESHRLKEQIVQNGGALISELPLGCKTPKGYFHSRNRLIAGLADCLLMGQVPFRSGCLITAGFAVDQGKELYCIPPNDLYSPDCMGAADCIREGAQLVFSGHDVVQPYAYKYRETLHLEALDDHDLLVLRPEESADMTRKDEKNTASQSKEKTTLSVREVQTKRSEPKTAVAAEGPYQTPSAPVQKAADMPVQQPQPAVQDDGTPRGKVLSLLGNGPMQMDELLRRSGLSAPRLLSLLTTLEMEGVVETMSGHRYRLL